MARAIPRMPFGFSTHLFHGEPLSRSHLATIAARGFTHLEVFATRTHFDYHDAARIAEVRDWIADTGLTPWSMHLPICDGFRNGVWGRPYSNASSHAFDREEAVSETTAAIAAARQLGCRVGVLHLGIPRGQPIPTGDNDPRALSRSLEPIASACTAAGVRLALEVIPNDLATPAALLEWLDGDLALGRTGVCLDFGHAQLVGGSPEAAEMLGGHIITTHVHDNKGVTDDHLVPFEGRIDWPATVMAMVKVGYAGPWIFELPDHGDAARTLDRATAARDRIQRILEDLQQPLDFS
jgi:sugar phosphate isomerase/epimerase